MSKVVIVVSASIFNTSTVLPCPSYHHPAPRSEGEQQGAKVIITGGRSYDYEDEGGEETYPGT